MTNITTAVFEAGSTSAIANALYQWDYGQTLRLEGVELPDTYEVHYANMPGGLSKTVLGGADGAPILDEYLTTGRPVYAWVYVHIGDSDGETVYMVTIPVIPRARPTDQPATPQQQTAIAQALNLLNHAIDGIEDAAVNAERAETAAEAAEESANGANVSAMQASRSAVQASAAATDAAGSASSAAVSTAAAAGYASQAAVSEDNVATNAARAEAAAESAAAFIDAHVVKRAAGQIISIDDAVVGSAPLSIPEGGTIYSRNMYAANITSRTSGGVTFTQDADDPNAVTLNGTATANAYSYGSITADNAAALLEPGKYYICGYADTTEAYPILYADLIDYATGEKTTLGNIGAMNGMYILDLATKSYVGVRVQLAQGRTVSNLAVRVYISALLPDYEYTPYSAPDGTFKSRSVVALPAAGDMEYYGYFTPPALPLELRIASFNLGEFDHGATTYPDTPADFDAYAQAIAEVGADILLTQEDRVYKAVSDQITTWDALYQYMYRYGGIVSNSTSTSGMLAKGIYSNVPLYQPRRLTFDAQATGYWSSMTAYLASVAGKVVLLVSVHLAPKQANASARAAQIAEIVQFVDSIAPDYCIIAGDMNTWSATELDAFTGFVKANCGPFGQIITYPTGSHFFDNILVTPNIKMQGVRAVPNDLGDHYALVADIILEV